MKINDFLKTMASEILHNNRNFQSRDIYYMLKYLGIKRYDNLALDIEKFYEEFLASLNNSLVKYEAKSVNSGVNKTHYIGFYTDKKADYHEAVKVYFPVKYEYMISALKTVFLYLIRNNIKATVKFYVKSTNEAIVIRFYEAKEVMSFINYCNNSFALNDLLEELNPFIASIHGLGLVKDNNEQSSYLQTLSELICDYLNFLKEQNALDKASDLGFVDYVRKREEIEEDIKTKFNMEAIHKNMVAILNHTNPVV